MINTGNKHTLYHNPPKHEPKKQKKKSLHLPAGRTSHIDGARAGFTTKEFRIASEINGTAEMAYNDISEGAKEGMQKMGSRMRTKTSGILKDAAYAESAMLHYSDRNTEDAAKNIFSQIIKREKRRGWAILGAEILGLGAFYVPPLLFVPFTSLIFGSAILYQANVARTLARGIKNISFLQSPEVSKLERIISGEKEFELTNPDLIEYRAAKGL